MSIEIILLILKVATFPCIVEEVRKSRGRLLRKRFIQLFILLFTFEKHPRQKYLETFTEFDEESAEVNAEGIHGQNLVWRAPAHNGISQ